MTFTPDIVGAEVVPTSKLWTGRAGNKVSGVVQHYTASLSERALVNWMPQSGNSAHIFIFRDGHVVQMVKFADRAFHAGDKSGLWQGKPQPTNANNFTIGIENCNVGWLLKGKDGKFYLPKFTDKGVTLGTPYKGPTPEQAKDHLGVLRWWEPYSDKLVASNIEVLKQIVDKYPDVTKDRVVFHSDISPKRKSDPGPLWPHEFVLAEVFGGSASAPVLVGASTPDESDKPDDAGRGNNVDGTAELHYDFANQMSMVDEVEDGMCMEVIDD